MSWQYEPTRYSLGSDLESTGPHPSLAVGPDARIVASSAVLVVDDDAAIRDSLRLVLSDEGYEVAEARDGLEALETLQRSSGPMVVVLDIMMPRLSGEEVLAHVLRDQQLHAGNAFIVITANVHAISQSLRERLPSLGIPVLLKPVDIDLILDEVARARKRLPSA